ncbi:MAG: TetR/AcrR family transcriptional regulator [Proteobacteria bacterium]|nr:TetR/AcrR family transcriptional regulator [Pseudomonadota bacterium]MBU1583575.1 TetR/AcrR family transcriptional regulator [Pseudomonadota bacterium]MBU2431845.1 TetR/AcrR family transcriptional regulator [Pseudomonadota bacterium]MBU2453259.1 TetR/AcrR family transcriptional regulator [Pseudomonadota bacterium]
MGRKSIADQRRLEIIQAFYRCVVSHGFSQSSIRKVAKEAGVMPSTLHHYFLDRDEMISQTVEYFTELISSGFVPEKTWAADDEIRLSEGLGYIFSPAMINPEVTGFFLECCVEARHNPKVRASVAKLFQRFRENILAHMGSISPFKHLNDVEKKGLASMIIAIHEGTELQWFADPDAVCLEDAMDLTKLLIKKM